MDLNQVRVFVSVVQAGGFSAAAKQLRLPVSTVSNRVSRLEEYLGVTLLQRTTRRINLTEAGRIYYRIAVDGIRQLLDAEASVITSTGMPSGYLRVTAPIDLGDHVLSSIIDRLYSSYPGIRPEIELMSRHADLVREGFDVAIRVGELKDSSLVARKIAVAEWGLFAGKRYLKECPAPQKPDELYSHRCLLFSPHCTDSWTLRKSNEQILIPISGHLRINDIQLLRYMVREGKGIALLPLYQCHDDLADGTLIRLLPDWYSRKDTISIVYPRQRFIPPQLRVFIDVVVDEFKTLFDGGNGVK